MKVPLLDLSAQHGPLHAEIMAALERVVKSQHFILGPEVEALEKTLAARLGVKHALGVSSGTDALLLALMALDVGPGDEVITSDYSFFATAGAVARLGAVPVFVDADPQSLNVDLTQVLRAVTPRTKAFIPVHLFGLAVDLPAWKGMDELRTKGIRVVEDAAQAIDSRFGDGRAAGTFGDIGCYSFFPSKNLGALGDGGLVVTNDDAIFEKMKALRAHGARVKYRNEYVGGNFRLDAIQAAVLRVKLPHLDAWSSERGAHAATYRRLFGAAKIPGLQLPPDEARHTYNQFVVRVPGPSGRRDELKAHLQEKGVQTEIYYPVPFHLQKCFASLGHAPAAFPVSTAAANDSLALPVAPGLTDEQLAFVVDTIGAFLR
jgi:dTDP-4-amino-4,6-dideoxygalactose transaminase